MENILLFSFPRRFTFILSFSHLDDTLIPGSSVMGIWFFIGVFFFLMSFYDNVPFYDIRDMI